jgi:ABC-2 type transport system permease protein
MNDTLAVPARATPPSRLFQWLRWRLLRNNLGVLVRRSPVRFLTIVLCSALIWAGVFALAWLGFSELFRRLQVPSDGIIMGSLFSLLFVVLAVLLLFSSGIILYSSLFSSAETAFLLSTPAPADQVYAFKYQGAVAFSSWACVLLGSPILIAWGILNEGTPWYFYIVVPFFFLGYVLVPGSIGALICLIVVNWVPRRRKQVLAAGIVLVLIVAGWWAFRLITATRGTFGSGDWVNQLLGGFSLFQGPLAPPEWMWEGIKATAAGEPREMVYNLALVWSNGLVLYLLSAWAAARLYRRGYNRVATGGDLRRRYGTHWLDGLLERLLTPLAAETRLLIVKDFRTFRRDPAQWAQILIFAGLACLYFTNIGRFQQQDIGHSIQKNIISLLNLAATAFLLCAYTGRFIYPMLSLEGRKFWILGLLPLQRDRLLWGKFAFSAVASVLIGVCVVSFSNLMLNTSWLTMGLHALAITAVALGLSGLSVGLGAAMPNFQESDPSKLAVGFGGTLNLVTGLLYLLMILVLMAVPWHILVAHQATDLKITPGLVGWVIAGQVAGFILTSAAIVLPLRMGIRALRRMEF